MTALRRIEINSVDLHPRIPPIFTQDVNRRKILPAEWKKTNKWLSEQLGANSTTISKWCTDSSQPGIRMVFRIMEVLDADINRIVNVPQRRCV